MSKTVRGIIIAAVAITLSLGAGPLASGSDLTRIGFPTAPLVHDINRSAKSDRAHGVSQLQPGRTVSVNLQDRSILVRIPAERASQNLFSPAGSPRAMVACEPMVSVLTDVAKLLQPGRCVT